mgnify:CR=1 FL=1
MVVTDLIYRLVGRSDTTWTETVEGHPERDTLHIGFSGDEDRRETVRSILQQSGVLLSEVERLRQEGVVTRIWLDDYCCGLELDLERTWLLSEYSRKYLEIWI